VATYFADTSFWIGLSSKRDQHHQAAVACHQFVTRTESTIVTTEAILLEWLNAMSDVSTRRVAAESYLRVRADARIEVVPIQADSRATAPCPLNRRRARRKKRKMKVGMSPDCYRYRHEKSSCDQRTK